MDYIGIPLNKAGRERALLYDYSLQGELEHQCGYYTPFYEVLGPQGLKIWSENDSVRGNRVVAWKTSGFIDIDVQTIWMDRRPHPSSHAFHPFSGFTTGEWEGDGLVAHTTHMKTGYVRRNGAPSSDRATLTQSFTGPWTTDKLSRPSTRVYSVRNSMTDRREQSVSGVTPFARRAALLLVALCAARLSFGQKSSTPSETDLTGYWVSVVTEDWRWRMVTPAKGDYQSVPISETGRLAADQWDPARDEAAGEQCKSYGAPALLRIPGRLHITWQDDNTIKVDADAGEQTRLLRFSNSQHADGPATWQGDSAASWQIPRGGAGNPPKYGYLKVLTTHLRPGYLRKNGIPYSAGTQLTEYWEVNKEPDGDQWLVVTTVVHDPMYLFQDWITSLHFKREPHGAKWDPAPCSARW